MNCAVVLLLTSSCFSWSAAGIIPSRAAPKTLKYLIDPPVYAEVNGRRGGQRHPAVHSENQTQPLQSEMDKA
ncbi:unnamed protein product [Pleuronectes platessa]|uniref:Secreted protein n=1 Tax=Pleuronectes platessa TaxID=8262 RepID=A0A9N7VCB7_PLEPL|nr:unnamed protein product [Pleuronectes platessa]